MNTVRRGEDPCQDPEEEVSIAALVALTRGQQATCDLYALDRGNPASTEVQHKVRVAQRLR